MFFSFNDIMKALIKIVTAENEFSEDQLKIIKRIAIVLIEHNLSVAVSMKIKKIKHLILTTMRKRKFQGLVGESVKRTRCGKIQHTKLVPAPDPEAESLKPEYVKRHFHIKQRMQLKLLAILVGLTIKLWKQSF